MSPRAMTRYVFETVSTRTSKAVPCPDCGKTVRRQTTITRTLNPFNVRADGTPKSYAEVQADNAAEAERWRAQPERCRACLRAAVR